MKIFILGIILIFFNIRYAIADSAFISMNFTHLDTRSALQYLAKSAHINMIISDQVSGKITLNLNNITWQQALQIILSSQGLASTKIDNTLYIAPANVLITQQKQANDLEMQAPLAITLIHLHYADAQNIQKSLQAKSLLSARGSVSVDSRTNSLLLQDIPSKLLLLKPIIKQLDTPEQEVLIKAKIVNVDSDYERDLGIKFSISNKQDLENLPNETLARDPLKHLKLDFYHGDNVTPFAGLALFPISSHNFIDLELAALEAEGHANIISNPELIASNEEPAIIEAGQEIPYQEKASRGTSITFKKAVLSLKVTPQIISSQEMLLHLDLNQDQRSSKEVLGVPTIDTRKISTLVLVKNHQTIGLGGIYEQVNSQHVDRVPFFSSIPIIGHLFQQKHTLQSQRELLIFITPELINQ